MTEMQSSKEPIVIEQPFQLLQLSIDPASGTILGPAGTEQLDPKVMAVLLLLARHSPELVTREQLFDEVWCDRIVSDETLTQCVYQLRQHLVAASGNPEYRKLIVTLPKRGYRLDAEIKTATEATDADKKPTSNLLLPPRLLLLLAGLLIGCYLAATWLNSAPADKLAAHSIAVLPFADFSPAGDQTYLADGLAEELIDRLAGISGLRVIARTSSFSFREKNVDIGEIARKLDVGFVLEGSIRKDGNRIRITVQLIDASTNSHVWSNSYERQLASILDVQSEIALSVADVLHLTLSDTPGQAVAKPVDPEAYQSYLLGRHFFNRRANGDIERSEQHYTEAVEIDPDFARAWAGLAAVYWLKAHDPEQTAVWIGKMGIALDRALANDPTLAEAHARSCSYYWTIGDQNQSDKHWRLAQQHGTGTSLISYFAAGRALRRGDYDRARGLFRKALQKDPLSATAHANEAYLQMIAGRFDAAEAALDRAEQLNPEIKTTNEVTRAFILVLTDQYKQALGRAESWSDGPDRDQVLAQSYFALGRIEAAEAAVQRLVSRTSGDSALRMAEIEAFRGDADKAFEWLEQISLRVGEAETWRIWPSWEVRVRLSPSLRVLHDDPRWEDVIATLPASQPVALSDGSLAELEFLE